jgi:hypothetical protein
MSSTENRTDQQPETMRATPRLDALLARLASRLTRHVWMHGLGTVVGATAVWLLFAFLADWFLHLPAGIRIIHLIVLIGAPLVFLRRDLLKPLVKRPDRTGRAVLLERAHPELKELLVSAVQFADRPQGHAPSGAPELVGNVRGAAETRASQMTLDGVLDPTAPRKRFLIGTLASVVCAATLVLNPTEAGIFLRRLAGGSAAWPQRTTLTLEVPLISDRAQIIPGEDVLDVRVARGSDVPVLVRAEGVLPEEVTLHFTSGHQAVLGSSGAGVFRTLLRSCQESVEFYATGGDDDDKLPLVRLTVLQPPDVAGVAVLVRPPAYSGLPSELRHDSDVDVLAGSELTVYMHADPTDATGVVRVLPEDRVIDLRPETFPPHSTPNSTGTANGPPAADGESAIPGLAFDLQANETLRYRFELEDSTGLPNPDPGLFAISVLDDRPPEIELLSPGRGDYDTVLGGALPLRVRVEDDFGLQSVAWSAVDSGSENDDAIMTELATVPIELDGGQGSGTGDAPGNARSTSRAAVIAARTLDIEELVGTGPVVEGQQFLLTIEAVDNRDPAPQTGRSAPARVRIVTVDEFLRRIQDRLARLQASASALSVLQIEKHRRTLDLLASLESDELPDGGSEVAELAAALTGQRRVLGNSRGMTRELAAITESVLFARVDERASGLLTFLDEALATQTGRRFEADPWLELVAAYDEGTIGPAGLSGKLVEILSVGLEISESLGQQAVDSLTRAQDAADLTLVHDELDATSRAQAQIIARVERLLELLAEWDNFQSVLSLTRDILSRQKNLTERTRQYAKEK